MAGDSHRSDVRDQLWPLGGLSLFDLRPLQYAISKRRRLIGNHIAADAGGTALEQERTASRGTPPAVIVTDGAAVGVGEEHIYG